MKSHMLLVVTAEARRHIYEVFLQQEQVSYRVVSTLREMVTQAAKSPHCGILLDMPILVKASQYDKNLSEDSLRALPSARLNIAKKNDAVLILPIWGNEGKRLTAAEFVRNCCSMTPKIVFVRNRIPLHLNALLAKTPDMAAAVQTACIDFSEGGCFLFSTDPDLVSHTSVWIRLIGLDDHSPIQGTICWKQEWGTEDKVPGIGIRFDLLSDSQQAEILSIIAKKREA